MKPIQYYKDAGTYPDKPIKPRIDQSTATAYEAGLYAKHMQEYENKMQTYNSDRDAYNARKRELEREFTMDAIAEVGLTGHPKAGKIFDFAWDKGHSHGYEEVMIHLREIAELFLD